MESQKIEISQKTIIFTIGTLLSVWLIYQIRAIVVLLFIAFILMTAINPLIKKANKFKIPTILVMLVVYFASGFFIYYYFSHLYLLNLLLAE